MGWTYKHAIDYKKNGSIDRKAEIDSLYNWNEGSRKTEVIRSCMVGSTYYGAIKITNLETGEFTTNASVVLTRINSSVHYNFGMKVMDESMGPSEYKCPASILNLLSPTDNEYAAEWRRRCRENISKEKDPHALKNLPVGSIIRFKGRDGKNIELTKHPAAYQFKRPFWYCPKSRRYMSVKWIPDDYEVVKKEEMQ